MRPFGQTDFQLAIKWYCRVRDAAVRLRHASDDASAADSESTHNLVGADRFGRYGTCRLNWSF